LKLSGWTNWLCKWHPLACPRLCEYSAMLLQVGLYGNDYVGIIDARKVGGLKPDQHDW